MTKVIVGVFAHPDDESFGPGGTLLAEVRAGAELYLFTLTAGGAGMNPDGVPDLEAERLREWGEATCLLGVKEAHFLGYKDGQLNNTALQEASDRLMAAVAGILNSTPEDSPVEFMAYDFGGLSGHIDHIVATRAAAFVFYRLRAGEPRLTRLRLFCLSSEDDPAIRTDWLFREAGRRPEEITETVDNRGLKEDIIAVMRAHRSQRSDAEHLIALRGERLGLDHFIDLK